MEQTTSRDDAILAAVMRASLDCLIVTDAEGRVLEFNPAAVATFGWRRDEAIGRLVGELIVPPAARAAHAAGMARYLGGGAPRIMGSRVEMTALRACGQSFPVELTVTEARAGGERLFAASLRDLSGQRAGEAALRESQSFLRALLDDQTELVFRYDTELRMIFCNAAAARSFALSDEALLGRRMWEFTLPEVWDRLGGELSDLDPLHPIITAIDPIRMPDGEMRWFEWTNRALFDERGHRTGYQTVGRDVTERRAADRARAESEERLAAFMRHAPVGMYVKDAAGRYLLANLEMEHVFGRPVEQVIGKTAVDLLSPDAAALVALADQEVLETLHPTQLEEHLPGLGRYAWTLVVRFPILGQPDGSVHIGGFDIDITPTKRATAELDASREALHQSEKLRAMGSLLAGVAHELNNPLSIVLIQAAMLEEDAADSAHRLRAAKIRQAAERCAKIVQTFMAMARQKPLEKRRIELSEIVRDALDIASYALETSTIDVTFDVSSDLAAIDGEPDQLHQLVLNLLVNAQQALDRQPSPREIKLRIHLARPGEVALDVVDNGPGIAPEHRERVFEPFFTTKPQASGMGFGLAFSRNVAEAHGGRLELLPSTKGAHFRLSLSTTLRPPDADSPQPAVPSSGARRSALVVDDEPEIASALAELLTADGYVVEVALSGEAAQRMIGGRAPDLILCDLRMPGLDGRQLFAWLVEARPDLRSRLAFVTGDALGAEAVSFLASNGRPVLEKPFTRAALRRVVAAVEAG